MRSDIIWRRQHMAMQQQKRVPCSLINRYSRRKRPSFDSTVNVFDEALGCVFQGSTTVAEYSRLLEEAQGRRL